MLSEVAVARDKAWVMVAFGLQKGLFLSILEPAMYLNGDGEIVADPPRHAIHEDTRDHRVQNAFDHEICYNMG